MPIWVVAAYVIFCGVPLAVGATLVWRRRRVERRIAALQQGEDPGVPPSH